MRIPTTVKIPTNRPVRKQPATVQPNFGPGPEIVGLSNPALTAKPAKKAPKTVPTPVPVSTPQSPTMGLYNDSRFGTRPPFTITHNPNPSGPRPTLAPSAPGATPPPNFGRPMPAPAAWSVAATLVSEG